MAKRRRNDAADDSPNAKRKKEGALIGMRPESVYKQSLPLDAYEDDLAGYTADPDYPDAMEYMRSVQAEALDIPHLLRATVQDQKVFKDDKQQGYYSDGAYIAHPDEEYESFLDPETLPIDPQVACRARMLSRFRVLREQLHSTPPEAKVKDLRPLQWFSVPHLSNAARGSWISAFRNRNPSPVQVACMDNKAVLLLLEVIPTMMIPRKNISKSVGAWIWSLLARLADASGMTGEEVWVVRELAKKAASVLSSYNGGAIPKVSGLFGDSEENSPAIKEEGQVKSLKFKKPEVPNKNVNSNDTPSTTESDPEMYHDITRSDPPDKAVEKTEEPDTEQTEELEARRRRILAMLEANETAAEDPEGTEDNPAPASSDAGAADTTNLIKDYKEPVPNATTLMTLDMIITVAGELYGQRDLLRHREVWA